MPQYIPIIIQNFLKKNIQFLKNINTELKMINKFIVSIMNQIEQSHYYAILGNKEKETYLETLSEIYELFK